ncbi:class II glutamine amidotransferase domain-containing protein [Aquicella lusitana]|uniref:Uncharacterized protein n=1 Tax=Aquicella lusitana TaxID=254246 RepID=A0A370GJM7_9COXI|nr:hypothetical protein [Aquicella lusitana]RDI42604.1 hypothetical protein C8D86_11475 [Aquicella lusitana]VVC74382.1 hypothetical protein AQULUS_21480 [Aquicella lusitana]
MVAIRYNSDANEKPATLYYATGSRYEYHDGACHISQDEKGKIGVVLVASERLTSYQAEWHEIPPNHMLLVHDDFSVLLRTIE